MLSTTTLHHTNLELLVVGHSVVHHPYPRRDEVGDDAVDGVVPSPYAIKIMSQLFHLWHIQLLQLPSEIVIYLETKYIEKM